MRYLISPILLLPLFSVSLASLRAADTMGRRSRNHLIPPLPLWVSLLVLALAVSPTTTQSETDPSDEASKVEFFARPFYQAPTVTKACCGLHELRSSEHFLSVKVPQRLRLDVFESFACQFQPTSSMTIFGPTTVHVMSCLPP